MNIVTVKTLLSGPRHVILAVYLKSDGITGDLEQETLVDPVMDLGLKAGARLTLECLVHNFSGFDACIEFESGLVNNNFKWVLSEGTSDEIDFAPFGGLIDDSGLDGTGKLQITTTGLTASTDQGSILIKARKP